MYLIIEKYDTCEHKNSSCVVIESDVTNWISIHPLTLTTKRFCCLKYLITIEKDEEVSCVYYEYIQRKYKMNTLFLVHETCI